MANTNKKIRQKRYGLLLKMFLSLVGVALTATVFIGTCLFLLVHKWENQSDRDAAPLPINKHESPRDFWDDQNSDATFHLTDRFQTLNYDTPLFIPAFRDPIKTEDNSPREFEFKLLSRSRKRHRRSKLVRYSTIKPKSLQPHYASTTFKPVIPEKTGSPRKMTMDSPRLSSDVRLSPTEPNVIRDRQYSNFQSDFKRRKKSNSSKHRLLQKPEKVKTLRTSAFKNSIPIQVKVESPQKIMERSSLDNQRLAVHNGFRYRRNFQQGDEQKLASFQDHPLVNLATSKQPHSDSKDADNKGASISISQKNHRSHTIIIKQKSHQPLQPVSEKRRSLLIFGDDRSGTTFVTKMFAEDPQMFTIYEPLWVTKQWAIESYVKDRLENITFDLVNSLLSCKFTCSQEGKRFLKHTVNSWVPNGAFPKNVFRTSAFAVVSSNGIKSWPLLSRVPDFAEEVCLTKFKHSVIKVGQVRVPHETLSVFIPRVFDENPDTEVRVIQIVRDPRGSINSRIKYGWSPDFTCIKFPHYAKEMCSKIAENIKFGRNLDAEMLNDRYMEVTYREIATMPVFTAQKMYKFAGFEMPDSLIDWIIQSTNPDPARLEVATRNPFSHIRDSSRNFVKWRRESPIKRVRIMEEQCRELLDLLGLEPVADEMELLCS